MTRSDIGVIGMVYAVCLLFLYMTLKLKTAAQIYPLCLIGGLALLDTLYLATRLWRASRDRLAHKSAIENDLPEIFSGFQARQFIFIVTACIAYMPLLHYLGFYLSSCLYLVGVMLWLQVRPVPMLVTVAILGLLIYAVFTIFLQVPLPKGALFD